MVNSAKGMVCKWNRFAISGAANAQCTEKKMGEQASVSSLLERLNAEIDFFFFFCKNVKKDDA